MNKQQDIVLMVFPRAFRQGYMGATARILQLATAWRTAGWKVVLLSRGMHDSQRHLYKKVDKEFPGRVIRTRFLLDVLRLLGRRPFNKVWRTVQNSIRKETREEADYYEWTRYVTTGRYLQSLRKLLSDEGHLKVVWGITTGTLDGARTAATIAASFGVPWILALHDPPHYAHLGLTKAFFCKEFERLVHDVTYIITTSRSYLQRLIEDYPAAATKTECLYMRYREGSQSDCSDLFLKKSMLQLIFSYVGHISGKEGARSIVPFIRAMEEICDYYPECSDRLRLNIAGAGRGVKEAQSFVYQHQLNPIITFWGNVTKKKAREIHCLSDFVIIIQGDSQQYQVPNKLFEFLPLGRPVLGLMPRDSEVAQILRRAKIGQILEMDDTSAIREFIKKALTDKCRVIREIYQPNWKFIREFSDKDLPVEASGVLLKTIAMWKSHVAG